VEVAVATGTPVSDWLTLPERYLTTAVAVLNAAAKKA
jgi:hypothetical protein